MASADGTSMYDAKTRRWISMIWSGDANVRRMSAVNRDGLYVYTTNTKEDLLRTTSIVRGNTTPIATAAPTVGTPDPVLGAVSGSLNVADADLDPLNYRVTGPLTAGTVSFNLRPALHLHPNSGGPGRCRPDAGTRLRHLHRYGRDSGVPGQAQH